MKIGLGIAIMMIGFAGILFVLIGGAMTFVRAKQDGILKLCFPAKGLTICYLIVMLLHGFIAVSSASEAAKARQVLTEAQTAGAEAFLRAENDTVSVILDEERYIERKAAQYQEKADDNQGKAYGYFGAFLCYCCCFLLLFGFVTAKGYYSMAEQKPRRLIPEEKDGELRFFTERAVDKPLLRVPDTPENREKYAALLNKDEPDEKQN